MRGTAGTQISDEELARHAAMASETGNSAASTIQQINDIHGTLTSQAFAGNAESQQRLQVVYGLNRRESVSQGHNRGILQAFRSLRERFQSFHIAAKFLAFY